MDAVLPVGFSARPFVPGQDDETWVRLNAAAFSRHPEQGRLTVADLHERMAQHWFDPAGLILVVDDATGRSSPSTGPRWSRAVVLRRAHGSGTAADQRRRDRAGPRFRDGEVRDGTGEVYVVGVDPAYQGRGLGGPVTRLGLAHLARLGLGEVELYVDGDNTAARRTYERLGFTDAAVDGQYTRRDT